MPDTPRIRTAITEYSKRTEDVLVMLLQDMEDMRSKLEAEIATREEQCEDMRDKFEKEVEILNLKLQAEEKQREKDREKLQKQIDKLSKEAKENKEAFETQLAKERDEREAQAKTMDEYFRSENEARKKNLDDVNEWIKTENEKRMAEAEALRAKLEREKQELRDFIERDNAAMKERMSQEEEERARKEREMQDKMRAQQEASENEIIQLYKKMANENTDRKQEIEDLRAKLEREKAEIREKLEAEKEELRTRLEKENNELRSQLESSRNGLKTEIDGNHFSSTNRINDLTEKLAALLKSTKSDRDEFMLKMANEGKLLRKLIGLPLSVYFCGFRTEDYLDDGEDYLTFQGCHANFGSGFDAKSGVFTSPVAGSYMFTVHVCTHDMHKALMSIRMNGSEVASFYDQNHESNHKNSMAGQSILLELEVGDKVQVYMFTHTGLQDKRSNHLTQFVGVLLRPKDFMKEDGPDAISNGH